MTRWIGSLLIAAISSVVTLLLAWSSLGPPTVDDDATARRAAGNGALSESADNKVALSGDTTTEMLEQLSILEEPEQGDQTGRPPVLTEGWGRPGSRDHRNGPPAAMNADPLSPRMRMEFCERCNEVANDIDPSLARRLAAMREQDPAEFDRNMKVFGRKLFVLGELKKRDPDLYAAKLNELRMELNVRQRAHDLREARAAGHKDLAVESESQLRSALIQQFAMSLKSRTELLCRLEEQVRDIRAEIEDQGSRMNEIIEERFQALLQNPQPVLGQATPPANPAPATSATSGKN